MYCTRCELEIKSEDKKNCPVCGSQLSDSHEDSSILIDQEQSAEQDIVTESTSVEPAQEVSSDASLQEDIFVLKDYESDSSLREEGVSVGIVDPQSSDAVQAVDGQPLHTVASRADGESVNDVLNSIRESIAVSEPSGDESGSVGEDSQVPDENFAFFDSVDTDPSAEVLSDTTVEQNSDISWGSDESAAAVSISASPERGKSIAPKIILIILLIAVGCYYAFTRLAGDAGQDDTSVAVNMLPSDSQQSKQGMQSEQELLSTSAVEATVPVSVDDREEQSGQAQSQHSQKVILQVGAEESVVTEVAAVEELAETAAPVAADALPAGEQAAALVDTESKAESVQAAVEESAETEPPVASDALSAVAPAAASADTDSMAEPVKPLSPPFFTVHVGSYQKLSTASSEVDRIKAKGYDAFIQRINLGKRGIWYRVKVGRFKIRVEAEQLQKEIKKTLVTDSMVVTQRTN